MSALKSDGHFYNKGHKSAFGLHIKSDQFGVALKWFNTRVFLCSGSTCLSFFSSTCPTTAKSPCGGKAKGKKNLLKTSKQRDTSLHTRNCSSRERLPFHHINSEMGRDGTCCRLYYKNRMGTVRRDIFPFQVVFCKLQRDFQTAHLHHGEGRQHHTPLWLSTCWCLDREKGWRRRSAFHPPYIKITPSRLRQCPLLVLSALKRCPLPHRSSTTFSRNQSSWYDEVKAESEAAGREFVPNGTKMWREMKC